MRGGEYEYKYKHIDFPWKSDGNKYTATFYGDISNNIGVIVIPEKRYIFNKKGISQIENTSERICNKMSNYVLFDNISAKRSSVLIHYNNQLNTSDVRNNAQIRIYLENYAQSNLPNDKIVKFDPSDPLVPDLISKFQDIEPDENNSEEHNLLDAEKEFIWDKG